MFYINSVTSPEAHETVAYAMYLAEQVPSWTVWTKQVFLLHTSELADFTAITNQVVTFQPGETCTEQFVSFTSNTDNVVEDTEILTAVLSNPSTGATIRQGTATISIMDVGGEC